MNRKFTFPIQPVVGMWIVFVVLAILNGSLRVYVIIPITGNYIGHVISSIILSTIIFVGTYLFIKKKNLAASNYLVAIGALWLFMTIAFEFLFGHFVMNHPWEKLLADYNIFKGRVWILVLFTTCSALKTARIKLR